jgi:TRAP-type C4-dicarboxylate transport system substrate-binding protein
MLGMYPGRFPLTEVKALPFVNLPSGTADGHTYGDPGINSYMLQELYETFPEMQAEWSDVKMLFFFTTNAMDLQTAKTPVHNQADLKGMKIRTAAGPALDFLKLLGAVPVNMTLTDTYDAAKKGVLDGTLGDWSSLVVIKLYEVFHYVTQIHLSPSLFAVVMEKETWNSLPPDIQKVIMSASGRNAAELADKALN